MKRIGIISVCFLLLISSCVFALSFNDLASEHWASEAIDKLTNDKVIGGYPDGSYRPEGTITYGEFIKLVIATAVGGDVDKESVTSDFDHWAAPYIKIAELYGIIEEGEITRENVDKTISRIDMVKIIAMADMILKENDFDNSKEILFSDVFNVIGKEKTLLQHAYSRNLILGYPDNTFNPKGNMTRAEAAMMIYRYNY